MTPEARENADPTRDHEERHAGGILHLVWHRDLNQRELPLSIRAGCK